MRTDPQIQIEDIDCPKSRSEVKLLIEDLIQLCPADSAVCATVRRIHDRFWAEIRVVFNTGTMQAFDSGLVLSEALSHLRANLLTQIVDWREKRFA
jgi:hypothetical protein